MTRINLKYNSSGFGYNNQTNFECWTFNTYCSSLYNSLNDISLLKKLVKLDITGINADNLIVHCFSTEDTFHQEIIQDSSNLTCFYCGVFNNDDCIYNGNCLHIIDILINLKFFDEAAELIKKYNWIPTILPRYDIDKLKFCLDHKANPNQWHNLNWSTILQEFINKKDYESSMLLINYKANPFIEGYGDGHVNKSAYEKANLLVKEDINWINFIKLCDNYKKLFINI
jgi:hypothetical protein